MLTYRSHVSGLQRCAGLTAGDAYDVDGNPVQTGVEVANTMLSKDRVANWEALAACTGSTIDAIDDSNNMLTARSKSCCYAHKRKPISHCAPEGWCIGYPLHCGGKGAMLDGLEATTGNDKQDINEYCDKHICSKWCQICCTADPVLH